MAPRRRRGATQGSPPPTPPEVERPRGKYERLARERHERDLALAARPEGHPKGFVFSPEAAARAVAFVETYCRHHKGEWAGRFLLLEGWQKLDVVGPIFGWLRPDGTRRFRSAYIEIPRKNGKTELAAGLGLYLFIGDKEPGAEVYSSATKRDQAKILWDAAKAMVRASPELKRFAKAYRGSIFCEQLGSKFEPLASDADTLDGLNPHGNLVDELHAHKDRNLWDVLDTAMGARRQPLTLAITTAGKYDPESIGWQQHDYATKVLEGVIEDDAFFAFIAAVDDDDDPYSREAWRKANPNLGVSVKEDYLSRQADKAKLQPSFTNEFLRLHLNRWTLQAVRWLSVEAWAESDRIDDAEALRVRQEREKALATRACYGGLDLSSKLDLTALVLAFRDQEDVVDLLCRFWLPEETAAEEAKKGRRHYSTWAEQGWLTLTPGNVIDYAWIRREVNELSKSYSIQEIGFDPHNATQISTELGSDGFQMVEFRQGFLSMSEPSKDFEARIVAKKMRHMGNPVLRWCVANAVAKRDSAGNIKPDKEKARGKIDGVVASIMATGRLVLGGQTSVYDTRGVRTLG